jgi:ribosomal protein S18 acetylase RimI-like enzyme
MALHPDAGSLTTERLGPPDLVELFGFLDRDPVLNVYLVALTLRDALARSQEEMWAARRGDELVGVVHLGGPSGAVLPVGEDGEALDRLAEETLRRRTLLPRRIQIVGMRDAVERFVRAFSAAGMAPRLHRHQVYMALELARLPGFERLPALRVATSADYGPLYESGAELRAEELEEDPRAGDASGYARRVGEESRDGSTWLWMEGGVLRFRASVSALTADAAQIAGVYTPARLRNRGYARRALSELCARLASRTRTACLFVNDFNAPALALYRRLGFKATADWASAFYDAVK